MWLQAQNIANTINNVFNVVFIALGDSVAIVVGQLLGAGDMKKAEYADNKMLRFLYVLYWCCYCYVDRCTIFSKII